MNIIQVTSLILSIIFLVSAIYMTFTTTSRRQWIYISASIGWLGGVIFYTMILVTDAGLTFGHDASPYLRLYQNICFGSWTLFRACEQLCATEKHRALQRRMAAWIQRLSQPL